MGLTAFNRARRERCAALNKAASLNSNKVEATAEVKKQEPKAEAKVETQKEEAPKATAPTEEKKVGKKKDN